MWGLETNIKGPPGNQGGIGPVGPAGPPGADSTVPGPPGATGPAGANGSPDTAAQVLAKLVTVDGAGSGLDADTIDGKNITVSATPPSSPNVGDIWIDTS